VTVEVGGRPLILETGKIAKQANGAITARYGDTVVLTTACMASAMNDRDLRALYRYVRSLAPVGSPAPDYLPPDKTPSQPYVQFPAPPK